MNAREIIEILGGTMAVARLLSIKPPSVTGWIRSGSIPDGRLVELAAEIEIRSEGRMTRQQMFPDTWQRIWPELAVQQPAGQGA